MKSYNTFYDANLDLQKFITDNRINSGKTVLVQVFTGIIEHDYITELIGKIRMLLPHAVIVGATTDGEIINGAIQTLSTALSFSVFEKTDLRSMTIPGEPGVSSFDMGLAFAQRLVSNDTKLLILFADGIQTNGEDLLKGIESVNPHVVIAGGLAGDNVQFERTYVFTEERVLDTGVVGVALNSTELAVNTTFHFDWAPIGKTMVITQAVGNRVYEIDHLPAIEVYRKYLGTDTANKLPSVSGMFPLVLNRQGNPVARTVLGVEPDGSLLFGGNVREGDELQFAYGNAEMILKSSRETSRRLSSRPIESLFIYTCSARRRFLPDISDLEISPLASMAPAAGIFTYGEFFHFERTNEILSQTMTVLALSEDQSKIPEPPAVINEEVLYDNGTLDYLEGVAHLINETAKELQSANQILRENEERYRLLVESCPDAIGVCVDDRFLLVNQAGANLVGVDSPDEMIGKLISDYVLVGELSPARGIVEAIKSMNIEGQLIEQTLTRTDGRQINVELVAIPFSYHGKSAVQFYLRDITERKQHEEQIKQQAFYDALTGLPNRRLLHKQISSALRQAKRSGKPMAVMFLDLDRFKYINDTLGHTVGDQLLRDVSKRLKLCVRDSDTVARLGGDEFTILLPRITDLEDATSVAERIIETLASPFFLQGFEFFLTVSIGISLFPDDGENLETLIKHADTAMYHAKENGRNNYQLYTDEMHDRAMKRLVMENALRKALERDEFTLHYQPIVKIHTNEITGMEALLRWNHPELGNVSPASFIPLAEETGLIVPIGEWVLRTACAQNKAWQNAGFKPLQVSVNFSAIQFLDPGLTDMVKEVLEDTGLSPQWLDLEMTESIMQNPESAIRSLTKLRAMGINISLDDFGTGYSSLSYLKRLPINTLKIDKSFIRDITNDPDNASIATAIITMAHSLRLKVVAEGVERPEQLGQLMVMQCDKMQGYLFSKPLPAEEFVNLLDKDNRIKKLS